MAFKLKQENFFKPCTAESIKVMKVIGNLDEGIVGVIDVDVNGTINPTGVMRRYHASIIHMTGRCLDLDCICTFNRLQANAAIRWHLANSPNARVRLREWRQARQIQRNARRSMPGRQRIRAANVLFQHTGG